MSTTITITPPRKNASAISGYKAFAEATVFIEVCTGVTVGVAAKVANGDGTGERFAATVSTNPFEPETIESGTIVTFCRPISATVFAAGTLYSWVAIRGAPFRLLPIVLPIIRMGDRIAITSEPNITIPKSDAYFSNNE